MPSPTTERVLLGHFPRGADLPTDDQHASPPPVRLRTSMFLWERLAAGDREGSTRGGAGRCKIPRDCRGGGRGSVGRTREGGGAKCIKAGTVRGVRKEK